MQNLRRQLLLSHLLLIGLMLLLLVGGIARFLHLGRSIDRVLDANVKSVLLMQQTKDALGELVRVGAKDEQVATRATVAIEQERGNITEPGEEELARELQEAFVAYRAGKGDPKVVSEKAQAILELNLDAMRRADAQAKQEARQSALLGAVATGFASLIAVLLALRAVRGALLPLVSLARQAEEIGAGRLNQRIELNRSDEIGTLAGAFNGMSERLAEARAALESRLVRAERMNDAALESLYDPVVVTDAEGKIAHLNQAATSLFGSRLGATVGEARIAQAVDIALREGRSVAADDGTALVSLKERTYRLRVSPMRSEQQTLGTVAVLEDVTYLREVDRLKTEFIGVASHELRTPVTSLLLSVQLLQEGAVGILTPAQEEIIKVQREDLDRLDRLLRDLLDLTRLESGASPSHRERVKVSSLVETALAGIRAEAEAKGVDLVHGDVLEAVVHADPLQIGRVLTNLLGNAIRHTPSGGIVGIETALDGPLVAFRIRDTGSGIPTAYLASIFERFTQVPGATRGGAGLGLSLAKIIVEAHGGTIQAQSMGEDQGSVFTFTLPQE
jgi:two-component system, NtrC family, sensor histidine kinase KinB